MSRPSRRISALTLPFAGFVIGSLIAIVAETTRAPDVESLDEGALALLMCTMVGCVSGVLVWGARRFLDGQAHARRTGGIFKIMKEQEAISTQKAAADAIAHAGNLTIVSKQGGELSPSDD